MGKRRRARVELILLWKSHYARVKLALWSELALQLFVHAVIGVPGQLLVELRQKVFVILPPLLALKHALLDLLVLLCFDVVVDLVPNRLGHALEQIVVLIRYDTRVYS